VLADQDSVRLLAVEGCAALGKLLEPQDCAAHILPVIIAFSQVLESFYWHSSDFFLSSDLYNPHVHSWIFFILKVE